MLLVKRSDINEDIKIKKLRRYEKESEDHYKPMTQRQLLSMSLVYILPEFFSMNTYLDKTSS